MSMEKLLRLVRETAALKLWDWRDKQGSELNERDEPANGHEHSHYVLMRLIEAARTLEAEALADVCPAGIQRLRLIFEVDYIRNAVSIAELKRRLESMPISAVNRGDLTGSTDAEVEGYRSLVVHVNREACTAVA
jgi:hypothetical protein